MRLFKRQRFQKSP